MRLNDISIKKKLFIIYFAALLLPLMIINILIVSNYRHSIQQQYTERNRQEMDVKAEKINEILSDGYYILQKFYSDRGLYRIMDRTYSDNKDFVTTYNELLSSTVLSFIPFYENIHSIFFFTSNPTVLNAGSIRFISESIKEKSWYRQLSLLQHFQVLTWMGSNQEDDRNDLHISILYPLNYYSSFDKYNHLMKVDLKTSSFSAILEHSVRKEGRWELSDRSGNIILSHGEIPSDDRSSLEQREIRDPSDNLIWILTGYYPGMSPDLLGSQKNRLFYLGGLLLLLYSSMVILWISRSLTVRMNRLIDHFRTQDSFRIPLLSLDRPGQDEIGVLIDSYNQMSTRINQLVEDVRCSDLEKKQIELERQKSELHALQSQVNPHYLFNTLETIRMKSVIKGEFETAEIIQFLSSSFRRMFIWGSDLVTIRESICFLNEYLNIQKYRLGEKLSFHIECEKELEEYIIPKMIIQPFVENSCRHGFRNESKLYNVGVCFEKRENLIQIKVEDNGSGMSGILVERIRKSLTSSDPMVSYVGFRNVYSRLKSYYPDVFFKIDSQQGEGTCITIRLVCHPDPYFGNRE